MCFAIDFTVTTYFHYIIITVTGTVLVYMMCISFQFPAGEENSCPVSAVCSWGTPSRRVTSNNSCQNRKLAPSFYSKQVGHTKQESVQTTVRGKVTPTSFEITELLEPAKKISTVP